MARDEVEEYLDDQTDDGARVDTGEFSVNWLQARDRLSSHNLIRPTAWVLYLVQAAVQWKCERLDIVQSRYLTRFAFVFSDGSMPTFSDFEEAVSTLRVNAGEPLEKLALVTEHHRLLPESQFQVTFRQSDDSFESFDFGELHWFDRFRKQAPNTIVFDINHWRRPDGEEVFPLLPARREQLAIRTELDRYCGPCPVPITLDSTPFHGLLHDFSSAGKHERYPWCVQISGDSEPKFPLPWSLREVAQVNGLDGNFETSGVVQIGLKLYPGLGVERVASTACSTALWVKHGVIAQASPLPFTSRILTVSVLVPADDLASDLTGFQVIDNDEKSNRLRKSLEMVRTEFCDRYLAGSVENVDFDSKRFKTPHPVAGSAMFLTVLLP